MATAKKKEAAQDMPADAPTDASLEAKAPARRKAAPKAKAAAKTTGKTTAKATAKTETPAKATTKKKATAKKATTKSAAQPAAKAKPAAKPKAAASAKPKAASKKKAAVADSDAPVPASAESLLPPMEGPDFPDTQYAVVEKLLVGFLAQEVRKVGLSRVVLGLSGGIDSAVSAALAARALGAKNVLGVMMPYRTSSAGSLDDATEVAQALGIETLVVEITAQVDAYFESFPEASKLRRGNKMARERMTILYDHSAAAQALVVGTSNKTELLLGYGTLYGDMASALNPIGDLYKTQVWGLARHLGLPRSVIEKAPTADLWDGQTDETELGFSYHQVDRLLYRMIDERCSRSELLAMGFDEAFVDRISRTVRTSQFKRRLPVIAKISARSIDTDFRYSRDWGL